MRRPLTRLSTGGLRGCLHRFDEPSLQLHHAECPLVIQCRFCEARVGMGCRHFGGVYMDFKESAYLYARGVRGGLTTIGPIAQVFPSQAQPGS